MYNNVTINVKLVKLLLLIVYHVQIYLEKIILLVVVKEVFMKVIPVLAKLVHKTVRFVTLLVNVLNVKEIIEILIIYVNP